MARYLGANVVLKSPRTSRTYTILGAARWEDQAGDLRPPAHIIGFGGFGVTYRAVDESGSAFAMKEYFPRDYAQRGANGVIAPKRSEDGFSKRIFEEGLRRFIAEGHLLSAFSHPNISRVVDAFDANGTSYQLMRLVEGREILGESAAGGVRIERRVTLEDYLRELEGPDNGVAIDLSLLEPILRQLLDAVEYVHVEGSRKAEEITGATTRALLHRDIKPANILIEAPAELIHAPAVDIIRSPETRALLIDFGSARIFRELATDDVSRSIGVVTEGYAPPELKDNDLEQQGPHTDIYSLAAVVWRAFTGRKPTLAQLANGARLTDLALPVRDVSGVEHPRAPRRFLAAIDQALSAGVSARPPSIGAWRAELFGTEPATGGEGGGLAFRSGRVVADGLRGVRDRTGRTLAAGGGLAAAFIAFLLWNGGSPEQNIRKQAEMAFADAERLSDRASQAADEAAAAAEEGRTAAQRGVATAGEAVAKYRRFVESQIPRRIYHGPWSGDPALGDREVDGGGWCHRKGADVIPDNPYSTYPHPDTRIDGESGWACGIGHTHIIEQSFDEPKNPWIVEKGPEVYIGEVNGEDPSGYGVLTAGDLAMRGRFTPSGSGVTLVGSRGDSRYGVFNLTKGPNVTLVAWRGEEGQSNALTFRGLETNGHRLGRFSQADGTQFVGGVKSGVAVGRMNLANGIVWHGAQGDKLQNPHMAPAAEASGTGPAFRAWGRLETSEGVYYGQITKGQPDGCGVWDRKGKVEVGFYIDGMYNKLSSHDIENCRKARYTLVVDLDDFPQTASYTLAGDLDDFPQMEVK